MKGTNLKNTSMDLKQQIEQLDGVIKNFEESLETLKAKLKETTIKRRKLKILESRVKEVIEGA